MKNKTVLVKCFFTKNKNMPAILKAKFKRTTVPKRPCLSSWPLWSYTHASVLFFGQGQRTKSVTGFTLLRFLFSSCVGGMAPFFLGRSVRRWLRVHFSRHWQICTGFYPESGPVSVFGGQDHCAVAKNPGFPSLWYVFNAVVSWSSSALR